MGRGETDLDALLQPQIVRSVAPVGAVKIDLTQITAEEREAAQRAGWRESQMRLLKEGLRELYSQDPTRAEELHAQWFSALGVTQNRVPSYLAQALQGCPYTAILLNPTQFALDPPQVSQKKCGVCGERLGILFAAVEKSGRLLHVGCAELSEEALQTATPQGAFGWLEARYA